MRIRLLFLSSVTVLLVVFTTILFGCGPQTSSPSDKGGPSDSGKSGVIKLSFSEMTPNPEVLCTGSREWAKKISELSGGRVDITVFPSQSLVKMADAYDAVLGGIADIARFPTGHAPGVFLLTEALGLPNVFASAYSKAMTFWELGEKYLWDGEYKNVKLLWVTGVPPACITTNKKQVKTLDDLQGMKLAVMEANTLKALKLLGAVPTPIPLPEMYTALERGMVDGAAEPCWAAVGLFKMYEVTKYRTAADQLWSAHSVVVMNLDTFNSLPADIQEIIDQNSGMEMVPPLGKAMDIYNESVLKDVIIPYDKEKGNPELYTITQEEQAKWTELVQPVFEEWITDNEAKGLPARAFVEDMMELAKKYN